jgi:hypothetical protein
LVFFHEVEEIVEKEKRDDYSGMIIVSCTDVALLTGDTARWEQSDRRIYEIYRREGL